ncbi:hypothetical protein V8C26DRAFT_294169 [Trichoderma gracile]
MRLKSPTCVAAEFLFLPLSLDKPPRDATATESTQQHGRSTSKPLMLAILYNEKRSNKRTTKREKKKTYNSRCSPVVTHLTTNLPLIGLTLGEQTGSRILQWIWSYVLGDGDGPPHMHSLLMRIDLFTGQTFNPLWHGLELDRFLCRLSCRSPGLHVLFNRVE